MAIHGYTWQYMAIHGYTWLYMAILYMAIHGNTWLYMAIHGYTWLYIEIVRVHMNVVPRSTGNTNSGTRELTLKCKL